MSLFKAYLTGVFVADGWLQGHNLGWETKDEQWILKISSLLKTSYSHRQRVVKTGAVCDIFSIHGCIDSMILVEYMQEYKNFEQWFYSANDQEQHEFIKGFFDGDGSICKYAGKDRSRVLLYVVDDFMKRIVEFYLNKWSIRYSRSEDNRGHKVIQYAIGTQCDLCKLFYMWYGEVYLNRKYELFVDTLRHSKVYQVEYNDNTYLYMNRQRLCEDFKISTSSVTDLLNKRVPQCKGVKVKLFSFENTNGFPTQVIV